MEIADKCCKTMITSNQKDQNLFEGMVTNCTIRLAKKIAAVMLWWHVTIHYSHFVGLNSIKKLFFNWMFL